MCVVPYIVCGVVSFNYDIRCGSNHCFCFFFFFFFQEEDGSLGAQESRGLVEDYNRQCLSSYSATPKNLKYNCSNNTTQTNEHSYFCLLYTADAADELRWVDLGGRIINKKKKNRKTEDKNTINKHTNESNISYPVHKQIKIQPTTT